MNLIRWTVIAALNLGAATAAYGQAGQYPANQFLGGPTSGGAALPKPRSLVAADLPLATSSAIGGVKGDGTTLAISGAGQISINLGNANTWTGTQNFSPAAGLTAAFGSTNTLSSSGSQAGRLNVNTITVTNPGYAVTGNTVDSNGLLSGLTGVSIVYSSGTQGNGNQNALMATGVQTGAADVYGAGLVGYSNVNNAGTHTIWGGLCWDNLGPSANVQAAICFDAESPVATGAAVAFRIGLLATSMTAGPVGSTIDAAMAVRTAAAVTGSPPYATGNPWVNGFALMDDVYTNGAPLTTTGNVFFAEGTWTTGSLINMPNVTFGTDIFNLKQLHITGAGNGTITGTSGANIWQATTSGGGQVVMNAAANSTTGFDGIQALDTSTNNSLFVGVFEASYNTTLYGQVAGNWAAVNAHNSTNLGLMVGTLTAEPLILGTNNTARLTISGAGLSTFSGHLDVEGVTSTGATGTGKFVFDTSPTLVTPNIGAATATSVNFGGQTCNTYNAGTWTPGVTASGTAGTPAYSTQVGSYEQICRSVVVRFFIVLSGWTGSPAGSVTITGLPVAAANVANDFGICNFQNWSLSSFPTNDTMLAGYVAPGAQVITVNGLGGAAGNLTAITVTNTGTTPTLFGKCSYHV